MPLPANLEVQPQEAPLNHEAQRALQDLTRKYQNDRSFDQKLEDATDLIREITGSLNDKAYDRKRIHDKKLARLKEKGEVEDEEDREEFEAFQKKAKETTESIENSMRKLIDTRVWAQELPTTLQHVTTNAIKSSTQATQRSTQPQRDPDEDDDDDMERDTATVAPEDTASALLHAALSTQSTDWNSKSLTDRYAHHNDYATFYKTLWDAQHPGENAPPLPAPALWFAREENPSSQYPSQYPSQHNPSQPNRHPSTNLFSDNDLEIAAERVSTKCPITLARYRDPVTSSVCNHSFERTAILGILNSSTDHAPPTPAQIAELSHLPRKERTRRELQLSRIKHVQCPLCEKFITEASLRANPVLLRKANREAEAERREEEGDEDEEDEDEDELQGPGGTQRRPFGVDGIESSPPPPPLASGRRGSRGV